MSFAAKAESHVGRAFGLSSVAFVLSTFQPEPARGDWQLCIWFKIGRDPVQWSGIPFTVRKCTYASAVYPEYFYLSVFGPRSLSVYWKLQVFIRQWKWAFRPAWIQYVYQLLAYQSRAGKQFFRCDVVNFETSNGDMHPRVLRSSRPGTVTCSGPCKNLICLSNIAFVSC